MNKYYPYTNPIYEKDGKSYKRCTKCDCHKDISLFNKNKSRLTGISDYCKECNSKQNKLYNKSHRQHLYKTSILWRRRNSDKVLKYRNKCQKSEKYKLWRSKHLKNRRRTDSGFNIRCNLSRRIRQCLKSTNTRKSNPTLTLLGCSIKELRLHLEKQFKHGMTWKNYGVFGWHIDHILPVSSFDLTKELEQKKCFHYSNLQPLWMLENIKKSNKLPTPQVQ
jgi:hypothetical protein